MIRYTIIDRMTPAMTVPQDSLGRPSRVLSSFMITPLACHARWPVGHRAALWLRERHAVAPCIWQMQECHIQTTEIPRLSYMSAVITFRASDRAAHGPRWVAGLDRRDRVQACTSLVQDAPFPSEPAFHPCCRPASV